MLMGGAAPKILSQGRAGRRGATSWSQGVGRLRCCYRLCSRAPPTPLGAWSADPAEGTMPDRTGRRRTRHAQTPTWISRPTTAVMGFEQTRSREALERLRGHTGSRRLERTTDSRCSPSWGGDGAHKRGRSSGGRGCADVGRLGLLVTVSCPGDRPPMMRRPLPLLHQLHRHLKGSFRLRSKEEIGDSVLVVGDEATMKVHVHTRRARGHGRLPVRGGRDGAALHVDGQRRERDRGATRGQRPVRPNRRRCAALAGACAPCTRSEGGGVVDGADAELIPPASELAGGNPRGCRRGGAGARTRPTSSLAAERGGPN